MIKHPPFVTQAVFPPKLRFGRVTASHSKVRQVKPVFVPYKDHLIRIYPEADGSFDGEAILQAYRQVDNYYVAG